MYDSCSAIFLLRNPSHLSIQVITLVIAYHLKAQQMGCFTKEEFMKGFEALGYPSPLSAHLCLWLTMASPFLDRLDTLDKIKKHMPKFRAELDDAVTFKNIYRFTFDFSKEPQQKCIGTCDSHPTQTPYDEGRWCCDATVAAPTASLLLLIVSVTVCRYRDRAGPYRPASR